MTALFDIEPADAGELERVARAQLDRLALAGVLTPDHDILRASILALARSMSQSAARGQSVALAHASRELREWYQLIPGTPDADDPFMTMVAEAAAARR